MGTHENRVEREPRIVGERAPEGERDQSGAEPPVPTAIRWGAVKRRRHAENVDGDAQKSKKEIKRDKASVDALTDAHFDSDPRKTIKPGALKVALKRAIKNQRITRSRGGFQLAV